MIIKLLLKVLFKACLPLVAMVGIVSYMLYMNGGDPLQMGKHLLSRLNFGSPAASATASIGNTLDALGSKTGSGKSKAVYKWVDAQGVTQYGSNPPQGAAQLKTIKISKSPTPAPSPTTVADDQVLPGMAGVKLPGNVKLPEGVDYNRILGQINEP